MPRAGACWRVHPGILQLRGGRVDAWTPTPCARRMGCLAGTPGMPAAPLLPPAAQVQRTVEAGSKEAAKAAQRAQRASAASSTGLDALLAQIEAKKKLSLLDKSKMDWSGFKKDNALLEEELEAYKKSGDKYLDKVGAWVVGGGQCAGARCAREGCAGHEWCCRGSRVEYLDGERLACEADEGWGTS